MKINKERTSKCRKEEKNKLILFVQILFEKYIDRVKNETKRRTKINKKGRSKMNVSININR